MLDKKEEHLNKKIADETRKAKANVSTNKRGRCSVHIDEGFAHHVCSGASGAASEEGIRE